MQYTANYNLKKPEGTDVVNIDDLNENADIIDQKLKELKDGVYNAPPNSVNDLAIGTRTPDQTQVPTSPGSGTLSQILSWLANRIKVITGKTNWWEDPPTTLQAAKNHIDASAPHSGHETPSGAQEKANAALNSAKQYTDQEVAEVSQALAAHQADYATFKNNTNAEIVEIKKKIGIVHNIESWAEVQAIVRAGIADQVFKVGDTLVSKYNGEEVIWTIIGIDHDTPTNTEYIHSLTIQTRDCLANIQFDAPEPTNPDTNRQQYGNNRYIHSAIRQWLNSNDDVFQWVPQHEYDAAPTGAIYEGPGFLKLLDPELVAVIGAVDKQVARNTVTDAGGQDLFSDKVFLLSRVEVYGGTEGDTTGEEPYAYYSALAGAPTTDRLAGRIKLLNGSPRTWWLRSPNVGNSLRVRTVYTRGDVTSYLAYDAYGLSPACCII